MGFSEPQITRPKQTKSMIPRSIVRRFKELQQKQHVQALSMPEETEILVLIDFIKINFGKTDTF